MITGKYFSFLPFFAVFFTVATLTACQKKPSEFSSEEGPLFRRGVVNITDQGLSFKPCYVNKRELINDHTGRLERKLDNSMEPAFYAEMSGSHIAPGEPWEVYQVHLIGGNQSTCNYELSGNEYRAAGDRPLWIADVRDDGIHVKRFDRLKQLIFPLNDPIQLGSSIEWDSELKGIKRHSLTLKVDHLHCKDRYGIEYEYTAQMVLNGTVFEGCARQGKLDLRTLPGLYGVELPGLRSQGRYISLELSSDQQAVLTQDYRNRQPLIVQTGSWQLMKNGRVVIHFVDIDGREDNEILIFEKDKKGGLLLKGYSPTFGHSGFRLERAGPERLYRKFNR